MYASVGSVPSRVKTLSGGSSLISTLTVFYRSGILLSQSCSVRERGNFLLRKQEMLPTHSRILHVDCLAVNCVCLTITALRGLDCVAIGATFNS
jgi:hypothetical protein